MCRLMKSKAISRKTGEFVIGYKYQFFNIKERPEIEVIGNIFSGKTKALR